MPDISYHPSPIKDETSGVAYHPFISHDGLAGYRCVHPDGRETFIYLNPTGDSDDGQANVFVYMGPAGHPGSVDDAPLHYYDIEFPERTED